MGEGCMGRNCMNGGCGDQTGEIGGYRGGEHCIGKGGCHTGEIGPQLSMDGEGDAREVARRLVGGGPILGSISSKADLSFEALDMQFFSLHI